MIVEQHYLGCLAQASYLIVDEATGTAAVIDPRRDVELYLERARELKAEIRHVLLTHFHADFLAGHVELCARTGATLHLGSAAEAAFAFSPLIEGERLALGSSWLAPLATPGHTPESISLLLFDADQSTSAPRAVFTGDTLFIGDVGRPDLMASIGVTADQLAGQLYDSLHTKLLPLPDTTVLYPGHGAGSMCGKNLSTETTSTIGAQRAHNYALQPMAKDAFVQLVAGAQPEAPAYFPLDAQWNREDHEPLGPVLERALVPLSLDDILRAANGGTQVLDVRTDGDFTERHLVGSLHVSLDGKFATWCGALLDPKRPIVLLGEPGVERETVIRLGRIGFDGVVGFLEGGIAALDARPELTRRVERCSTDELATRLAQPNPPLVIDIRGPGEVEAGAIEPSEKIPLVRLPRALDELPRDRELILVCKTGYRSAAGASVLRAAGFEQVLDLEGGMDAWTGQPANC